MEESWRFPPVPGHICPTCRVSHFPFCPPPRPFYGNGFPLDDPRRYPIEAPLPFHRPLHAPPAFPEHHGMPLSPLPHHLNRTAPRNVESWNAFPPPDRKPFCFPFHASERPLSEEFMEREKFHKRMRVEEGLPGYSTSPQWPDRFSELPRRISSEDERRLNLIRDHGRALGDVPFDGEQRPNGVFLDRYPHVDSQSHYARPVTDRDLYRPGSDLTRSNGPATSDPSLFNHKSDSLRENAYGGSRDPTGTAQFQDHDRFVDLEAKEMERRNWEARLASNNARSSSSYIEVGQGQYGPSDAPSHPSRSYGYSDMVAETRKSYTFPHNQEDNSKYKHYFSEKSLSNSQKQDHHSSSFVVSQELSELLRHQQHLQQTGVSEPQYPHADSYQASILPDAGHYSRADHAVHEHVENKHETRVYGLNGLPSFEPKAPIRQDNFRSSDPQNYQIVSQSSTQINQRGHLPVHSGNSMVASVGGQGQAPQSLPQLPQSLPRHPPESSLSCIQVSSALSMGPPVSHVTHIPVSLSVEVSHSHAIHGLSEVPAAPEAYFCDGPPEHISTGVAAEGRPLIPHPFSKQHLEEGQPFSQKHALADKRTVIDASQIFRQPHRATRPDHIVVILRGLPGSGKSYLAKALRDLEVDTGGNAPRIHCMDDYFMTEVEKVEESEGSKPFGSVKGKKQVTKKVMEYCYEPEMEEAYRSSMLKAFKKTVEDGIFTFVIVDDRNLRVADFAQFWAIGKRSGYEVYLLEATYKDPTGCAARNVHGFTLDDIKRMAEKWEEAPAFYLQLEIQSLFRGDSLNEDNIQEVDMDTEDTSCDERIVSEAHDRKSPKGREQTSTDNTHEESAYIGERWHTEGEDLAEARELGKSKWSKDLEEDVDEANGATRQSNALSGLIQAYGKGGKSVHWSDQFEKRGFSIGASNNKCISSLIIGPGSGYNLKANPLPKEESSVDTMQRNNTDASRKHSVFLEHIRAERESFKAVFDRRRQRIGGLNDVEDD